MNIFNHYSDVFSKLLGLLDDMLLETFKEFEDVFLDDQTSRIEHENIFVNGEKMQTDSGIDQDLPYSYGYLKSKGFPDGVDLKKTGEFYASFKAKATKKSFEFSADFMKGDHHIGENFEIQKPDLEDFEESVLGITREDWEVASGRVVEVFLEDYVLKFLKEKL